VIFIDTGAFVGRYLVRDQHHRDATRSWKRVGKEQLFTSNLVLSETITLLGRWTRPGFAAERARSLLRSERLRILRSGLQDELDAVDLLEKFADQKASFVDCVSFVLMRKRGIERVFTFDRHFRAAGYRVWPG
jgi:predicted nucleic acid-binding protein